MYLFIYMQSADGLLSFPNVMMHSFRDFRNKVLVHIHIILIIGHGPMTTEFRHDLLYVSPAAADASCICSVLKRVSRGEQVWDPTTATARLALNEYVAATESLTTTAKSESFQSSYYC